MAPPTLARGWKDTVEDGVANPAWDAYDALIQAEVAGYNTRLAGTPGFVPLDWKLFKAMLWVESGGPSNPAWTTRPMQIGNPGDPGYAVLREGREAAPLVMSDQLRREIGTGNIGTPALNVRAGIAYAVARLARSDLRSVDDPRDMAVREYTVAPGDGLERIASKVQSTVPSLQAMNPTARVLQPGQKLRYRKARVERVITGWYPATPANLASRYNAGDAAYALKLEHVLALFRALERSPLPAAAAPLP